MLIANLDTRLMHISDVVHTQRSSEVIILASESFHGNDVIWDDKLETLASFADEALLYNHYLFLPISLICHILFVN
jgi:hypothetical protein